MPNFLFSSFVSNFWQAITCKKIEFGATYSSLIEWVLKILINDGFIKHFYLNKNVFIIEGMSLDTRSKYNRIILYSSSKKIKIVTNKELIKLCGTGGYFVLSTPFGIMNDSTARKLKTGGVLLFGIF